MKKKHKKSIMQVKDRRCYLCMLLDGNGNKHTVIHEHHVYPGCNRAVSEANGFKVYLCPEHHVIGPEAVHNNEENKKLLQRQCQMTYEEEHTRAEFMALIGKNYLLENEDN